MIVVEIDEAVNEDRFADARRGLRRARSRDRGRPPATRLAAAEALAGAERDQLTHDAEQQRKQDRRSTARSRSAKLETRAGRDPSSRSPISRSCRSCPRPQYRELHEIVPPGVFKAGMGAEAVYDYIVEQHRSRPAGDRAAQRDAGAVRSQAQEGDQATARGRGAAQERQPAASG